MAKHIVDPADLVTMFANAINLWLESHAFVIASRGPDPTSPELSPCSYAVRQTVAEAMARACTVVVGLTPRVDRSAIISALEVMLGLYLNERDFDGHFSRLNLYDNIVDVVLGVRPEVN